MYEYISKKKGNLNKYTVYKAYDEALEALHNHSIDYFIDYKEIVGELIQMHTENLTYKILKMKIIKKNMNLDFS